MYGSRPWLIVTELIIFLVTVPGILGWGLEGHYATCKIAEVRLFLIIFFLCTLIMSLGHVIVLLFFIFGSYHYCLLNIIQGRLSEEALAAVKRLLPELAKGDLAEVCSWPDDIRRQYRWSSALHFADTPDHECNYNYIREY